MMTRGKYVDVPDSTYFEDGYSQSSSSGGVWRNARQTLRRAKQEARQTFRSLTLRWPVRRHHSKANPPNVPLEWQQPEGVASNATNTNSNSNTSSPQNPKGGPTVTYEPVTAPLAKPEAAEYTLKPASTLHCVDTEQAGSVRGYGASPKFNHRFVYADDEDPGIMSESETSATGSAYGRRNVRNKYTTNGGDPSFPTSSTYNVQMNSFDKSLGLVFLHYQCETKRALLPDEIRSLNDIRTLFIKAFPTVLNAEYLQAPHVKIYIQDPTRQDVFYELDDLREIKDRSVLKLHEQLRPISPIPMSASGAPMGVYETTDSLLSQPYQSSSPTNKQNSAPTPVARTSDSLDINGYNDQDFERSYRLQKCVSSSYTPSNGFERRYGTLDSNSSRNSERIRYSSAEPPSKPQRYASPMNHGSGPNGRCSRSPPSSAVPPPPPIRSSYGAASESKLESAYAASRGYPSYAADNQMYNSGNSDRSSSVSRCGSVTPVIDEEARVRMINMEKQLANLSSLVHSALMAKGVSETVYKDIEMLRREILGPLRDDASDSGSVSRFSDVSSDKGSFSILDRDSQLRSAHGKPSSNREMYPSAFVMSASDYDCNFSPEAKSQMKSIKKRVNDVQMEVKQLRRAVQLNAQTANDVLKDVFDRIKIILNTNKHLHMFAAQAQQQNLAETNPLLSDRSWVNQEQERYRNLMRKVEQELGDFEKHIEDLRQRVINGERKLRLSEVEAFTESLTHIGRTAANLKNNFPSFQQRLKQVMGAEMEKVVKEEKFLKDEPHRLDGALQRCKKLTGTMLTMKKLALVQDRSAYYNSNVSRERPASTTPFLNHNSMSLTPLKASARSASADEDIAPPLPPPPKDYRSDDNEQQLINGSVNKQKISLTNGKTNGSEPHVLDTLLEELQTVAGSKQNGVGEKPQNGVEKRVGFADHVKHIPIDDYSNGNDTIKRSPKTSTVFNHQNGHANGPLNGLFEEIVNGDIYGGRSDQHARNQERAQSSTPSSVSSDGDRFGAPPPPPIRSSSRTMVGIPSPPVRTSYTGTDIDELKKQLMTDINGAINARNEAYNGGGNRSASQTPTAMVMTNAVDAETSSLAIRSASSSDSVNSQDAARPKSPFSKNNSTQQQNGELSARELFFRSLNNGNGEMNKKSEKTSSTSLNGSQWI